MKYPYTPNLVRKALEELNFKTDDPDDCQYAFSIGNQGSDVWLNIPKVELAKHAMISDKVGHIIMLYIQAVDKK
jgi:hypothetical protein